ncbi:thiolase family protein [Salibacterium qingdaonense]|uniref:Acetyl-CoA C-acetyltransferase n=1 Tax=Salibacterium qingdaonense TaxID=266892 RepID=A0A1I4IRH7_9BACI|nr:thiolase family protein [Salibacterium qingdaonense]SFL56451.1 acetyl-CoA C-acetyltransferase [Salibacterium qingdaonense]
MSRKPVIVCCGRTPIGKAGGSLRQIAPERMAAAVFCHLLEETGVPAEDINDVVLGNVIGPGGNLARLSALAAGFPVSVPGVTVDRQCGSGMEAVSLASRLIQAGAGDVYIAGGVESVSLAPWKMEKPGNHYKEYPRFYERARFSPEEIGDPNMGTAAERTAEVYGISRQDQDAFAAESHRKAVHAREQGWYNEEIVPLPGSGEDEGPRTNISPSLLQRMPPAFVEKGTVTAGNSCPVNDGAAAVLLMSEEKAEEYGLAPELEVVDTAAAGVDPNIPGLGAVPAVKQCLADNGLHINDISQMEFNEAFASQTLACLRELSMPLDNVNTGGGAIALGHPYGASGAVNITRLWSEMKRRQTKIGIAVMGIGGGMGTAVLCRNRTVAEGEKR